MLAARLYDVIPSVINVSQSRFVLGRKIIDNVLLATELIRGYGARSGTPRCMIKIDLRKAYDSVEWSFIKDIYARVVGVPYSICELDHGVL